MVKRDQIGFCEGNRAQAIHSTSPYHLSIYSHLHQPGPKLHESWTMTSIFSNQPHNTAAIGQIEPREISEPPEIWNFRMHLFLGGFTLDPQAFYNEYNNFRNVTPQFLP